MVIHESGSRSGTSTQPGYRFNQEVAGSIDLSPTSAAKTELTACCNFLDSLVGFVPGATESDRACGRAIDFIEQVRQQAEPWAEPSRRGSRLRQSLVFTLPASSRGLVDRQSTLANCLTACRKHAGSPSEVWVVSPFFDAEPANAEDRVVAELCKGMARKVKRRLSLCLPSIGDEETERLAAPLSLYHTAVRRAFQVSVEVLPSHDGGANTRAWHAKMLGLSSGDFSGLLIGSSNFTMAGMGVGGVYNAEANLLYVARREAYSREAGELDACRPETRVLDDPESAEWARGSSERLSERIDAARQTLRDVERDLWKQLLAQARWRSPLLVLDEAHHLKNPRTALARQLQSVESDEDLKLGDGALSGAFDRMLFLTATPFQLGHHELVRVLHRFGDVRWNVQELGDREDFESRLEELNDCLTASQRASMRLQGAWTRLGDDDVSGDVDNWWNHFHAANRNTLTHRQRTLIDCFDQSRSHREHTQQLLRPWIIRHNKGEYWSDNKT